MFTDSVEQGQYWSICRQHRQTSQGKSSSQSSWGSWVGLWSSCCGNTVAALPWPLGQKKTAWSFYFRIFLRTTDYIVMTIFDVHTFLLGLISASPYRIPGLWNKVLDFLRPSQLQNLHLSLCPFQSTVDKLIKKTNLALVVGTNSWREQFIEAITVSAGECLVLYSVRWNGQSLAKFACSATSKGSHGKIKRNQRICCLHPFPILWERWVDKMNLNPFVS